MHENDLHTVTSPGKGCSVRQLHRNGCTDNASSYQQSGSQITVWCHTMIDALNIQPGACGADARTIYLPSRIPARVASGGG